LNECLFFPLALRVSGMTVSKQNPSDTGWAIETSVQSNAALSIEHIGPRNKGFTGFYKIRFHGTANAAGSGTTRRAFCYSLRSVELSPRSQMPAIYIL